MLKWNKILWSAGCLAHLLLTCPELHAQAADIQLKPAQMQNWSNGANVTVETDPADDLMKITVSTKGLEKGFYTAYVFENSKRDWSDYGELTFSLRNESKIPIRINVAAAKPDGKRLVIADNKAVMIQRQDRDRKELVYASLGTIELEGGFQGVVRVPFASIQEPEVAGDQSGQAISEVESWGIIAIMAENVEQSFLAGDFQLVPKEQATAENELSGLRVTGDQQVQKPVVGESIAQYRVENAVQNLPVMFRLGSPVQGASITREGRLILQSGITADKLTVLADIDGKWSKQIDVNLISSWTLNVKEKDGTSLAIPSSGQMPSLIKARDPFLNEELKKDIRIAFILTGGIVGLLYGYWRRKARSQEHGGE